MALLSDDDVFGAQKPAGLLSDDDVFGTTSSKKSNPLRRMVADPGISALKGAISVPEAAVGVADMLTGGRAGKAAEELGFRPKEAKNILDALYSPEQRAANEAVQKAEGFGETLSAVAQNPSVIPHAVVESLPAMGAGGVVARGLPIGSAVVRGALGEGVVGAGMSAEGIRQESESGLITPKQSALAAASGAGTMAFGAAGGKLASKLGIGDVDTMLAGGAQKIGNKGIARSAAGGALSEGVFEELPQSIWEQAAQNVALDRPVGEGVGSAAAMGLLTGGVMGAGGGGFGAIYARSKREQDLQKEIADKPEIAGLLPPPASTGMPSDQMLQADVARQNAVDAAQQNADSIYAERAAYEQAMQQLFPFGQPQLTQDVAPLQQRIDAMLGVDVEPMNRSERAKYERDLAAAFNEPVGITHDENGLEIPLTMGALLDSQITAERMAKETARAQYVSQQSEARAQQLADEETAVQPEIPVVGPLSAAAKQAVDSGVAANIQARKALEADPTLTDGGGKNGNQSRQQANAEMATPGAQGAGSNLPGGGSVLAPASAGNAGTGVNRAEVAASSVRPAVPAGTPVDAGLVRSYQIGQATMLANRLTRQGMPSEIYPHPTQAGMFAIRPQGQQAAEPVAQPAPAATPAPTRTAARRMTPIMRRNDLVGAIMRATGGRGINANMAMTLTGDTANNVTKLRGLFSKQGQQDMDDLAMLLREQEGFDVRDAAHLKELIREAASGNVARSMEKQEQDRQAGAEKQYRDQIRASAKKYGFKTVAVKFSELEKIVLKRLEERHNQAVSMLDDKSRTRFESALEEAMTLVPDEVVDETLADVNRRGLRAREFWNEATRILRGMIYDAKQEAANETATATEEVGDGRGNSGTGVGTSVDQRDQAPAEQPADRTEDPAEEQRPGLALQGQTPDEIRAQEAQRQAEEARASRPAPVANTEQAQPISPSDDEWSSAVDSAKSQWDRLDRGQRSYLAEKIGYKDATFGKGKSKQTLAMMEWGDLPSNAQRLMGIQFLSNTTHIDAAAHEAATSPQNDTPEPSQAQKEAGNYKVGRVKIAGLDISIENPEGSTRSGTDPNGKPWSITMQSHYGYIRKTEGRDGDHVDVFVKPGIAEDYAGNVFIIDQRKANGHFDEHKVMIGWPSEEEATAAYLANYAKGWTGLGAITPMSIGQFKAWVDAGDQTQPMAPKTLPERVAANKQKKQAENAERAEKLAEVMSKRKAEREPSPVNPRLNMRPTVVTKDILTPAGAITSTAMKGKGAVWFHQGDPNHIQFRAKVKFSGQSASPEAVAEWERLQKARELGYRLTNRRAGSYGTVWTLERNNETLTKDGFASINDPLFDKPMRESAGPGYDNMVSGQATYARKLAEWFATLPESTLRSASALATKINNTPIGEWASIQRDRTGQVRMDFEDANGKLDLHMFTDGGYLDQVRRIVTLAGEAKNKGGREWFQVASAAGKKAEEAIASDSDIHDLLREYGFEEVPTEQTSEETEPEKAEPVQKQGSEPAAIEKTETDMTPDWDSFAEFWNGMIEGKGTIDDLKKSFALLVEEADAFRATIAKMKNDQLKRMLGWSARPDDKKADLVRKVYEQTLDRFTLSKPAPSKQWTYGEKMDVVEKRYQDQLRAIIDGLTDADLAEFRDSIAENGKARKESLEKKKAAAADPKTLEDFEVYSTYSKNTGKTAVEARKALTPEQRALWDSLLAEKSRSARQSSAASQKAEVKVAAQTTGAQIVEGVHSKHGYPLWSVQLADKVDGDSYKTLLSTAKRMGGNYVNTMQARMWKTVWGFQFRDQATAEAFMKLAAGDTSAAQAVVEERRDAYADDRSQTAVERLTEMADRLEERADESLGRERKANTARRARFAAAAENAAQSDKALAKTMRNIAEAIQNGVAKLLDRVRQKAQVEMLQEFVRNAKDAELRAKYTSYMDQERHKGEAPEVDTPEFAQWPSYTADRSDLANLGRRLLETEGTKKLGQQLLKIADDVTAEYKKFAKENLFKVSVFSTKREGSDVVESAVFPTEDAAERAIARSGFKGKATTISFKRGEHLVIMGPTMARERGVWAGDDNKRIALAPDSGELLVEKLGKMARTNRDAPRIPWQFENAYDKRKRLAAIGIETPAEFRSALREFIGLREQAKAPDQVKELERSMIGRKNDGLDFFPTPKNVAQQMIDAAEIKEGMSVLEPSAGWGHIAEQIREAGIDPDVVELSNDRKDLLEAKGFRVVGRDFMDITPRGFTFGDVFRAPDGTVGVMRGSGGLGSNRVGLDPLGENGQPDARRSMWVDRDSLEEVEKRGASSGYDRILMNPPFSDRRDAQHVQHAYSLLRPGGRLVAIMGEGVFFGQDKKAETFRNWLEEVGGTSEQLEEGSFLDPSLPVNTGVNARMVVIDKLAGQTAPVETESAGPGSQANDGRITPADKAIYGMAAEGKSATEILKFIADTSRNPFNRQLAKLLQKTNLSTSIAVGDSKGWKFNAGEGKYAAAYNPKTDTAALFRPAAAERNVLHELMHAATLKALAKKGMASAQMNALFKHVKASGKLKGMYGMADVDEFVAEAFTNPKFQQALKGVSAPVGSTGLKGAWHWFVRVVRGILGLHTGDENALSAALEIGVEVMQDNMKMTGEGTGPARFAQGAGRVSPIDTPEFKAWFGDSKVVDADGKPLVVYHGTASDITAFDINRSGESTGNTGFYGAGAYFSEDADYASGFSFWAKRSEDHAPNVVPVYLSLKNPAYINITPKQQASIEKSKATAAKLISTLIDRGTGQAVVEKLRGFVSENKFEPFMGTIYNALGGGAGTTALLKEAGFDGVTIYGGISGKEKLAEAVAFHPEQIKSAIGNNGNFDPTNPDIRFNITDDGAWSVSAPSKMDDVIYSLQDKHIDTKRVVQAIMKTGKNIRDAVNPYLQEELFHGRAARGVKDFLDLELRPLLAEMQRNGVDMGDFEEYLWNRHAPERNAQIAKINPEMKDGGSGIKTADAKAYLSGLSAEKKATFDALAKRIDAINRNSQEILVSSGLEKQETIDAWNGAYKHYVPLRREDVDTGHVGTGKGFSVRGSSTKRAMGSGKQVVDIIANITLQRERNIVRAEKNRVSNALMGLALENENADFWQVDKAPKERVVNEKAIYTVLDADGKKVNEFTRMVDAEKALKNVPDGTIEQTWGDRVEERIVPGFTSRDNVILTRVNGEDHYIIFNERDERAMRMAAALKNLDADNLGRVLSVVGKATRYLASINTQYNPVFGVINLIRDAQGALLNLSSTPLAGDQKRVLGYTKDALVGIYKDIRAHRAGKKPSSNWSELFEEFQREGGQTGYRDQYANAEQRAEAIKSELKQFSEGKAKQLTRGVFGWLSDYNETMENAVRLAAYKAAKEKGISNQQAASIAKNITVNFNRKGQMATQVGALYAFFNASVQGTARIAETLFEPNNGDLKSVRLSKIGKRIITGGIMLGSMQAMLLAAAGYDDDEPPDFVRERNLILPIGGGKYLTLAMPLGFHVLPGIGRVATEFVLSGGKHPMKHLAALSSMFADTFNPIGNAGFSLQTVTPSVVDPFAALAENKDFTGKEIYRENFNSLNPQTGNARAKDVATFYSKMISSSLNWITGGSEFRPGMLSPSPDAIDYLIGQVTGGVGREAGKIAQTGGAIYTGEELPLHKVPLVGRFIGDTEGQSGQSQKFYDGIRQLNMLESEYKGLLKAGRRQEAAEFMAENPGVKLIMAGNFVENQVRKLRSQKRELMKNGAPPESIKAIDTKITETMRKFNERTEAVI